MSKKTKITIEGIEAGNTADIKGVSSAKELESDIDLAIRNIKGQEVKIIGVDITSDYANSINALENVLKEFLTPENMANARAIIGDLRTKEPKDNPKDSKVLLNLLYTLLQIITASHGAPQLIAQALEWIKHIKTLLFGA